MARQPLDEDTVASLIEAARWAPSSSNNQPWRFVLVSGEAALAGVRAALTRGNSWAKAAPLLVVVTANPEDDTIKDGKPYYLFDCGLAVQNLLLQATAMGLHCRPMVGWNESTVKEALGLPEENRVVVLVAVGYPGDVDDLDEQTRAKEEAPSSRKPLAELVHWDRWQA